ncbi:putative Vacuolar segregation subunit 7-domain-containing protein [Seiridium unicorne]|uniref:Vacuolar segregation subunit 7-domain-containing protein n=1 Tax=Seiridium unicorne TaxID=138068 RepID=A0ABR2UMM5_9PEZI
MDRSETLPHNSSSGLEASISSLNSVDRATSATSSGHNDTQQSRWTSTTTSLTASPLASREPSPTRSLAKTGRTSRASTNRSRKNSFQDPSPSRLRSTIPTSTPRQQISAATTPTLPPPLSSETALRTSQPQKPAVAAESSRDSPRWPVSPRLKSPPPALNRPAFQPPGRGDREPPTPLISVQRATPSPHPPPSEPSSQAASDVETDEAAHLQSGMRTPVRGASGGSSQLETVQEVSQPNTPGTDLDLAIEKLSQAGTAGGHLSKSETVINKALKSGSNSESGSDSGSIKTSTRRSSAAAPPPLLHNRQSSSALRFGGKGQPSDTSKHITVEEEEVSSGPRLALGLNPTGQGNNGSLKTKPSSETIRPKKEKKKTTRKAAAVASGTGENPTLLAAGSTSQLRGSRSIRSMSSTTSIRSPRQPKHGQGPYVEDLIFSRPPSRKTSRTPSLTAHVTNLLTGGPRPASSKADIFEAKVASAVEEANSSDSDETFVYDSNPPDAPDRPRRYHSRTPSATSMVSQVDRSGLRSIHAILDGGPANPAVKKSMKFVNTYNSNGTDSLAGDDDGKGTGGRSNAGSARGTGRHHHHANRWGRNNSSNHLSLFDNESPFPNAARSKLSGSQTRHSSNPPSPRFAQGRGGLHNSKRQMQMAGSYDLDDTTTTGADDERTPLLHINGNRSVRSNRSRRTPIRTRSDLEAGGYHHGPSFLNRFASCLVLTIMLLLVIMGAVGFMFATSQPLTEIELVRIENVLASEQELMMDITVRAHNPNIVVVSVDSADLEVFAKSPHAGTDSEWWRHPQDGVEILDDPPNDPPGDAPDEEKSPNMRLGNIMELDSPLSFEGTFFQSGNSMSSSELRLVRPGNGTEGGSERWERILDDEFTLILKGVLKYTLPLSQKVKSVSISGKTTVKPNSASDPVLKKPNGTDFEVGIL